MSSGGHNKKSNSLLFPTSERKECDCPDEKLDKNWLWSDCDKKGHEEGCFVVWCQACDIYSADCDNGGETWREIPNDWK